MIEKRIPLFINPHSFAGFFLPALSSAVALIRHQSLSAFASPIPAFAPAQPVFANTLSRLVREIGVRVESCRVVVLLISPKLQKNIKLLNPIVYAGCSRSPLSSMQN